MWRALVLRGGGVSVEFQVGLLKGMADVLPAVDFFAGTGMGALSATVLAQYQALSHGAVALQRLWDQIGAVGDVIDAPWQGVSAAMATAIATERSWAPDSICGNRPLLRLIREHMVWGRLEGRGNWAVPVASLSDGHPYPVTNHPTILQRMTATNRLPLSLTPDSGVYIGEHLTELVGAACSTPLLMPPVDVSNHRLVTGQMLGLSAVDLAIEACRLAVGSDMDARAEIVVVENTPVELKEAGPLDLDSGREIALRALRMWSSSQLAAELAKANNRFSGYPNVHLRLVRPQLDHGLHPMQFGALEERMALRHHGTSRAAEVFGYQAGKSGIGVARHEDALKAMVSNPQDSARVKRWLELTRKDPQGARHTRARWRHVIRDDDELTERAKEHDPPAAGVAVESAAEVIEAVDPHHVDRPRNFHDIVQSLRRAVMTRSPVKAVGANYAFDNVTQTSGRRIEMNALDKILEVDRTVLRDPALAANLARFEAGITVERLNAVLRSRGKALFNQPGYEKLSFVGAMSVGGHGSGIHLGPLASQVRSVRLLTVDADGQVLHRCVEPRTDAITDPQKFALAASGVELVQDDDVFNSVITGLGCLGIIYSVTVEVRDLYFLQERRRLTTWEGLTAGNPSRLQSLLDDPAVHSVHVWLNPYPVDGTHSVVVSEYREHSGPARGKRGYGVTWGLVDELAPVLLWLMEHFPTAVPPMLDDALEAVIPNGAPPVLPCYEALNFGTPNDVEVVAAACGIPADKVVEAGDLLIARLDTRAEHGAYVTSPIGFRFVASTNALMAMQHGRDTCMIELPLLAGTDYALGTLDVFHEVLREAFGGRPHWGQVNRVLDGQKLRELYGDSLETFLRVFREYNPIGLFDNEFTAQLGLRDLLD